MKTTVIFPVFTLMAASLLLPALSVATIYQWTDNNGDTHFTDKPTKGAQKVVLPKEQVYSINKLPLNAKIPRVSMPEKHEALANARSYTMLRISEPLNNATIRNGDGLLSIHVSVDPELVQGDRVVLLLDGQAVGEPQASTVFTVSNVYRGTHTVAANVIDKEGRTLHESEVVHFHMHRPGINVKNINRRVINGAGR